MSGQTLSGLAYVLGLGGAIVALVTRRFLLGSLLLVLAHIQLGEWLIWRGLDIQDQQLNRTGTSFIKVVLAVQLVVIALGIVAEKGWQIGSPPLIAALLVSVVLAWLLMDSSSASGCEQLDPNLTYPLNEDPLDLRWSFDIRWYLVPYIVLVFFLYQYLDHKSSVIIFMSVSVIVTGLLSLVVFAGRPDLSWGLLVRRMGPLRHMQRQYDVASKE